MSTQWDQKSPLWIWSWEVGIREVDNVHMGSMKREGVKGKAENNTRVTRQRAVPFEVFSIHLPFIT